MCFPLSFWENRYCDFSGWMSVKEILAITTYKLCFFFHKTFSSEKKLFYWIYKKNHISCFTDLFISIIYSSFFLLSIWKYIHLCLRQNQLLFFFIFLYSTRTLENCSQMQSNCCFNNTRNFHSNSIYKSPWTEKKKKTLLHFYGIKYNIKDLIIKSKITCYYL